MAEQMMLEQVRDILRQNQRMEHAAETRECNRRMADAIDAHLNAAKGEAVATDKLTLTAPERIYLQISDEPEHRNEKFSDAEVTWCSESVLACEVKYIRADLARPAPPNVVRDAERYRWLRDRCDTTTGFLLGQRIEAGEWDATIDAAMAAQEGGK